MATLRSPLDCTGSLMGCLFPLQCFKVSATQPPEWHVTTCPFAIPFHTCSKQHTGLRSSQSMRNSSIWPLGQGRRHLTLIAPSPPSRLQHSLQHRSLLHPSLPTLHKSSGLAAAPATCATNTCHSPVPLNANPLLAASSPYGAWAFLWPWSQLHPQAQPSSKPPAERAFFANCT